MAQDKQTEELLNAVIAAHGGLDRWNRVQSISCTYNLHGMLLELKGHGGGTLTPTITVNTKDPPNGVYTNLIDNKSPPDRWIFTPEHVSIVSPDGEVLHERSQPRAAFAGHGLLTPWDDLHLLYFTGYAVYNYLVTPFMFLRPGFVLQEIEPHQSSECPGQTWRVLEVTHPTGWAAHGTVQQFYFGAHDFLLKRLDYHAEVVAGYGAHFVYDYKRIGGLLFPTARRVVTREAGTRNANYGAHSSFQLQYTKVKVVDEDGTVHEKAERIVTK